MALIGDIRKHSWFLILVMALCLGGFILMDIVTNTQRYSSGDNNTMGKVNGAEISRQDFESYREAVYSRATGNDYQVRTQVWNHFVDQAIVKDHANVLGLGVSKAELMDLQFGTNLSPLIQERFRGQDGQIDMNQLNSIKSAIETGNMQTETEQMRNFWNYWAIQENEIIQQRLQDKMQGMVSKGMYTPSWMAEAVYKESNERISFTYARVPYDKVPDGDATLTDEDYASYLKANPHLYDQTEEQRVINFVTFDVVPTSADTTEVRKNLEKLIADFRAAKNDSVFVVNNGGTFDNAFKNKNELSPEALPILTNAPLDSVVGPYIDGASWTIAKVLGRKSLPDSVRARHILIREANAASEAKLDSLKKVIEGGQPFDAIAKANSQDPGSGAKGGDLGYFAAGMMVKEFNDVCFNGEQGKLYKVATQFGWHLIEITGKKFTTNSSGIKYAVLSERIVPGKGTQQAIRDRATTLMQSSKTMADLEKNAQQMGLQVNASSALKENDYSLGLLGQGNDVREIIKWAFNKETDVNDVAKQVFSIADQTGGYFDSKYIVAALKSVAPKGAATVESLKANARAEGEIKNRKKAGIIKSQLGSVADLASVASKYSIAIDTAANVTMTGGAIPKVGPEPRVVGTAFSLSAGAVSKPVAGNSGVYVIQTLGEKSQVMAPADLTMFRRQATSSALTNIRMNFMTELRKNADVRDNRARFF